MYSNVSQKKNATIQYFLEWKNGENRISIALVGKKLFKL